MTTEEAKAVEAWKRAIFFPTDVEIDWVDPDPHTYFCQALVKEVGGYWRRCHSWTYGTRGGKAVCSSHYRSREVAWEKE